MANLGAIAKASRAQWFPARRSFSFHSVLVRAAFLRESDEEPCVADNWSIWGMGAGRDIPVTLANTSA